jgi:hypothetical protein|mmetsp:Transcript_787/g.98  ORF Transcript_787/g.98 Transcript_787/m.98 type:complete len:81 (+) Transcript_787:109-351(+)
MNCDVVCIQEVNFEVNRPQLTIQGYELLTSPLPNPFVDNPDPSFLIHGNAVLYSNGLVKEKDEQITLIDNERIATLIEFS